MPPVRQASRQASKSADKAVKAVQRVDQPSEQYFHSFAADFGLEEGEAFGPVEPVACLLLVQADPVGNWLFIRCAESPKAAKAAEDAFKEAAKEAATPPKGFAPLQELLVNRKVTHHHLTSFQKSLVCSVFDF